GLGLGFTDDGFRSGWNCSGRNGMRFIAGVALVFGLALVASLSMGDESARMPIQVTPYYNSQGPLISVGPLSTELTDATKDTIPALATKMKQQWETLPVEAMYVLAIRLYDLGLKDDAVFWFYAAQWRGFLYRDTIPPDMVGGLGSPAFEHIEANKAF